MNKPNTLTYGLMIAVIIIWALAWPISKLGLEDITPMWFTALRLWSGFISIFIILGLTKKIKLPRYRDLPLILSIGLLQMSCFLLLLNGGLLFVDAGRAAILVYSTPFILTPIAIMFFGEKLNLAKFIGLVLGLVGILILFNPKSFDWSNRDVMIGNVLLLLAAACWAITALHTRYGTWHSSALDLIPWQLLIASVFVLIACLILNPHPKYHATPRLVIAGLYNGLFATGFAYPAIIYVSQRLSVITTSTLLLAVPVLGLISSALWLGEQLTTDKIIALTTIVLGLIFIISSDSKKRKATGSVVQKD